MARPPPTPPRNVARPAAPGRVSMTLPQAMQQGVAAYNARDLARAQQVCRAILDIKPDYVDALNLLAVIASQDNRLREAADLFGRALAVQPDNADTLRNHGVVLHRLGQCEAALASLDRAIALRPAFSEAMINRGDVLARLGRADAALASYDQAIALRPDNASAHINRGDLLQTLERFGEAIASFDRAIALRPDFAEAHYNRGNALQYIERHREAIASYDRAIGLRPDFAEAYNARGNAHKELLDPEAALRDYDSAVRIRPRYLEALCNRGVVLQETQRVAKSVEAYDRALAIDENFAGAQWGKSLSLLLGGDYAEGWKLYESRWRNDRTNARKRSFSEPLWLGRESLVGKTVLLYGEQGLGDTIQFCRYVPLVADLGAHVVLEVQAPLVTLLRSLHPSILVIAKGATLPAFDFQCPLLSLPLAFGTEIGTIPAPQRYLSADATRVAHWREKLGRRSTPRVGLVWASGPLPNRPENWSLKRRDIKLTALAPWRNEHITFVSLQKGEQAEAELEAVLRAHWSGPKIASYSADLVDFAETAALIDNLDLVIAVDTATAHLAAALGKPLWLLNRYDTCWRWLLDREDSLWYPTAKLYRQTRMGDWSDVVERVRRDLAATFSVPA